MDAATEGVLQWSSRTLGRLAQQSVGHVECAIGALAGPSRVMSSRSCSSAVRAISPSRFPSADAGCGEPGGRFRVFAAVSVTSVDGRLSRSRRRREQSMPGWAMAVLVRTLYVSVESRALIVAVAAGEGVGGGVASPGWPSSGRRSDAAVGGHAHRRSRPLRGHVARLVGDRNAGRGDRPAMRAVDQLGRLVRREQLEPAVHGTSARSGLSGEKARLVAEELGDHPRPAAVN